MSVSVSPYGRVEATGELELLLGREPLLTTDHHHVVDQDGAREFVERRGVEIGKITGGYFGAEVHGGPRRTIEGANLK